MEKPNHAHQVNRLLCSNSRADRGPHLDGRDLSDRSSILEEYRYVVSQYQK